MKTVNWPQTKTKCGEEGVLEKRPLAGNEDSIPDDVQKRVVGGAEVKPRNRYPWMALIKDNEEQLCGGAIINDRFVLTAAHCIDACEESSGCKVVLGVHNIRESKGAYDIDSFIKHDEYSLFENDIGLIKLKRRIRFNESMKPICLPKQQSLSEIVPYSENITSAGWGLTSKGRGSDVLMEFVGEDWLKGDRSKSKFCKNLLCLRQVNGRFESGDSGGPAWIKIGKKDHVVGVISHYRLHRMRLTRVALVVDWIIDKTRGAYYCY
ncbi:trypsin-1-like protein [Dinothrombium tinctorium]|uniref:Trypsin-1-like protein n=1 Tax=Dinothrombium tinctorium TaxID=1965070 RepID=A0A3S3NVB1_9ACAR|nr:trypsin-1-like protein [Dinothrombium tinctorium]